MDYFKQLRTLSIVDVTENLDWATAPIIVTSNRMRVAINDERSKLFAWIHGRRRFRWRIPLCDTSLPQQTRDYLYDHNLALHGWFVEGAPAIITTNINSLLGLANGTKLSLSFSAEPPASTQTSAII